MHVWSCAYAYTYACTSADTTQVSDMGLAVEAGLYWISHKELSSEDRPNFALRKTVRGHVGLLSNRHPVLAQRLAHLQADLSLVVKSGDARERVPVNVEQFDVSARLCNHTDLSLLPAQKRAASAKQKLLEDCREESSRKG